MALPLIPLALGAFSAWQGAKQAKKSDQYNDRALRMAEQQYNEWAPLRQQGRNALSQIEAPIDMGDHMYDSGNPYAAARGRSPSVATMGDWGRMTSPMETGAPSAVGGLEDAKNSLRQSGMPVGVQERIMRGWDAGSAQQATPQAARPTGAPMMQPQMQASSDYQPLTPPRGGRGGFRGGAR